MGLFSIQTVPTLGPKVGKYHLHGAIWIPRASPGADPHPSGQHGFRNDERSGGCSAPGESEEGIGMGVKVRGSFLGSLSK